jgi:hypothetical protein
MEAIRRHTPSWLQTPPYTAALPRRAPNGPGL